MKEAAISEGCHSEKATASHQPTSNGRRHCHSSENATSAPPARRLEGCMGCGSMTLSHLSTPSSALGIAALAPALPLPAPLPAFGVLTYELEAEVRCGSQLCGVAQMQRLGRLSLATKSAGGLPHTIALSSREGSLASESSFPSMSLTVVLDAAAKELSRLARRADSMAGFLRAAVDAGYDVCSR